MKKLILIISLISIVYANSKTDIQHSFNNNENSIITIIKENLGKNAQKEMVENIANQIIENIANQIIEYFNINDISKKLDNLADNKALVTYLMK